MNSRPASIRRRLDLLTDNELATISATIAAQEVAMQQRQVQMMNEALAAPDATLPSYEEVMNVVREEEKREWNEKQRLKALEKSDSGSSGQPEIPPPSYREALRLNVKAKHQ